MCIGKIYMPSKWNDMERLNFISIFSSMELLPRLYSDWAIYHKVLFVSIFMLQITCDLFDLGFWVECQ